MLFKEKRKEQVILEMMINRLKKVIVIALCLTLVITVTSCGEQKSSNDKQVSTSSERLLEVTDENEKAAVEAAKKKVDGMEREPRIIATSPATVDICNKLDLDLVGVCQSDLQSTPKKYAKLPRIGMPMSPDMEKMASLKPDWVLSPVSLQSDLKPKYEAIDTEFGFLNLNSVAGMYRSILELGEIFGKEKEAEILVDKFKDFYDTYSKSNQGKEKPKVLILMGLPGSYIVATENSYVGSLVEMAGGENVYAGSDQEFLTVNTEDMKTKEPDIILRAAHAMPDSVMKMFKKEFKENDIWKHFSAVKNNRVYDLSYENFGMSATFDYPKALEELQSILYPNGNKDIKSSKEKNKKEIESAVKSSSRNKN